MKNTIMTKASGALSKAGFHIRKHSPEILIAAGVVGTVVSAVMACKATIKAARVVEETTDRISTIHQANEMGFTDAREPYSDEDCKKDLTIVYVRTGIKFAKLYAPAVLLGAASITGILTSHRIMTKRNVALAAAYATIDKSFKEYRHRVAERFGEAIDRELRYNIKAKEIEETVVDENGKKKKMKKPVEVIDSFGNSDYARFFDESSRYWEKNGEYNLMFLRAQQQRANDILRSHGFLFLNEVYRMLGIKETIAGQSVGWVYDRGASSVGDNFVDFGIMEIDKEAHDHPEEEPERVVILDFNVDGNIMNRFVDFDTTY